MRVLNLPFYEDPLFCLPPPPPPLFKILCRPPPSLNSPPLRLFLLQCFLDWIGYCTTWCFILLNDIMDLHMWMWSLGTRRTLQCVLCNKVSDLLRSDTWCGFLLVLSFDITQTHKQGHTPLSGTNRMAHPYKYILTPSVISSQQLYVLYLMNNSQISKIYFLQCLCFLKITHL